jgi:tetratricopeptide (TPR) repeat protein
VGFLNLTYQLFSWVADHFQYLASMGPAALAGAGIVRIGDLRTAKGWLVPAALVLFLAAMGWRQAWIYRDSDTLWNDTLAKNPNCWLAYNRLASHLLEDGKVDEAIAYFQKTLQLQIADKYNPYDAEAHDNLGIAYAQKEEKADAIAEFKEAIALNPDMADAHYNLGLMYAHADQFIDALAELQKAHQLNPGDAEIEDSLEHAAVIVQGK